MWAWLTGIMGLWRVIDSWMSWECLCGHDVCEWCSCPPPAPSWLYGDAWTETDMMTQYDLPRSQLGND